MTASASTVALHPETATQFFRAIFDEYDGDGYVEFRLLHDGKAKIQKFIPLRDALDHFPQILAQLRTYNDRGANIYMGILPRDREEGTAEAVSRCRALWVDVDRKSTPDLVDRFNRVIDMGIPPSFVIETGGGVHGYWILRDTHTPTECVPIMEALARHLGGDRVWDAPRIMRLPGTFNQKIKGTPRPCFVFKSTGRTYSLSDFEPVVASAPATPAPAPFQKPGGGNSHKNGHHYFAQLIAPFWREGVRHQLAIGTAGMLKQGEVEKEDAEALFREIATLAGDTEIEDRLKAVETTYAIDRDVAGASLVEHALGNEASRYTRIVREQLRRRPPTPVKRRRFPDFDVGCCAPVTYGFFLRYLTHAYNSTDAPIQYQVASAATIAAAALGNRVWTTYPHPSSGIKLFTTLYTMLAAKTSRYRKSTAISIARHVTKGATIDVYSNNATPEQLFVRMAPEVAEVAEITDRKGNVQEIPVAWKGSPSGIIFHPEFSAILATVKKSYMSDLFSLYTDLYDGSADGLTSSRETKSAGRYFISDPAISMLVGVTPAGLRDHLERTSMSDGFMTRFLYVLAPPNHTTRDPWDSQDEVPIPPPDRAIVFASLVDALSAMKNLKGEMTPTVEAARIHQALNREIDRRIQEYEMDGVEGMDALIARLPTMAVKLSMVYSCAMGGFPQITAEASRLAVNFMLYTADTAEAFYATMRPEDRNRDAGYIRSLLELLRRMGNDARRGISRRILLQRAHLDVNQFDRAINTLLEEGRVVKKAAPLTGAPIYTLNEVDV